MMVLEAAATTSELGARRAVVVAAAAPGSRSARLSGRGAKSTSRPGLYAPPRSSILLLAAATPFNMREAVPRNGPTASGWNRSATCTAQRGVG